MATIAQRHPPRLSIELFRAPEPQDLLVLPEFGLRCRLSDLYRGTALQAGPASGR